MTHEELAKEFEKKNQPITNWCPLVGDECEAVADLSKPIIKVWLKNGHWLRVYVSRKYGEITWY